MACEALRSEWIFSFFPLQGVLCSSFLSRFEAGGQTPSRIDGYSKGLAFKTAPQGLICYSASVGLCFYYITQKASLHSEMQSAFKAS